MIYALCRILVKCRDLRIFPGKKFRIPGTKNYYAALIKGFAAFSTQNLLTFELLRFLADLPAGLAGSAAANKGDERTGTSGNFEAWNKTVNKMNV